MALNSSPRTWVSGETVTAAEMNAEIRDAFIGVQAAWTSFVPTWASTGTQPVLNNGTITGSWLRIGKTADIFIQITMGSSTTYGTGNYVLGVPATLKNARGGKQLAEAFDSSASAEFAIAAGVTAGEIDLYAWPAAANAALVKVTPTVPFTWATGDILTVQIRAELA